MRDPRIEHFRRLADALAVERENQKKERVMLAKWLFDVSAVLDGVESIGRVKIPDFWHERMKRASEIISSIDGMTPNTNDNKYAAAKEPHP